MPKGYFHIWQAAPEAKGAHVTGWDENELAAACDATCWLLRINSGAEMKSKRFRDACVLWLLTKSIFTDPSPSAWNTL